MEARVRGSRPSLHNFLHREDSLDYSRTFLRKKKQIYIGKPKTRQSGIVVHTYNPSVWKAEAVDSQEIMASLGNRNSRPA